MMNEEYLLENENQVFLGKDIDKILLHTTAIAASDVTIQTNEEIKAEVYGCLVPVTRHKLNYSEVEEILKYITRSDGAISHISKAAAWDVSYEVKPDRHTRFRFRVNATGIHTDNQVGIQITIRTIPTMPPLLEDMKLPRQIIENMAPKQGMVLVTGATGSGKSTLLAAIIRRLLEEKNSNRKILTFESPIEFVYDDVIKPTSSIAQTPIPELLPSFEEALRNSLRRKPAVILVGEMRDRETISQGITASMTGHLLYSTVHTNGVSETVRRMVNSFPAEEQDARAGDIITALKMVVSQMLIPSTDGKRVALREYLVMTDDIAMQMLDNVDNLPAFTRTMLKEHGQTFAQDAAAKYAQGLIDDKQLKYIMAISRGMDSYKPTRRN